MSRKLQEAYESMPQEAKDDFWRHLNESLKWRRRIGIGPKYTTMSERSLDDVADVFWKHARLSLEEYT